MGLTRHRHRLSSAGLPSSSSLHRTATRLLNLIDQPRRQPSTAPDTSLPPCLRTPLFTHIMASEDSPAPNIPDCQPNPIMVGPGMKSLGEDAYTKATNATPSTEAAGGESSMRIDPPSYFNAVPGAKEQPDGTEVATPSSPAEAAKNARSGKDLLRRLSLVGVASPVLPEVDPREQHPGLRLSGRIISAALCIPYRVYRHSGLDWVSNRKIYDGFNVSSGLTVSLGAQASSRNVGAL